MAIDQDGGMHEEHSRYDDELATLHDRLADTTIAYGAERARRTRRRARREAAPPAVKAARAAFMAKEKKAIAGKGDLVESIAQRLGQAGRRPGRAAQGHGAALDKPAQAAVIAKKQKEREEISQRIDELGRLRKAELDARDAAAAKAGVADGFDVAAKKALRKSVSDNPPSGLTL